MRHVIPNAGHALLPEQPEAVAAHILSYLRATDGRRSASASTDGDG